MPVHDPTEHIQTPEDFERELRALTVRAERAGGYPPLVEGPITTIEQIDDVLDALAGATPERADIRQPRFMVEAKMRDWRKQDALDPAAEREELNYRRDQLRVTLTKLWRRGRDVAAIVNALDRARFDAVLLVARRGQPDRPIRSDRRHPRERLKADAAQALIVAIDLLHETPRDPRSTATTAKVLTAVVDAMQALILHHVDADRLVRKLRGPGTLEEFLSGETTHLYSESAPARHYVAVMHAVQGLRRALRTGMPLSLDVARHAMEDARCTLRTDSRLRTPARPAHPQMLIATVKAQLKDFGVGTTDASDLMRATGLLALTRTDRLT